MDTFSAEHIHDIILGLEGRQEDMHIHNLHLNVPNSGSVPNLPDEALLELTVDIGTEGVVPVKNPPIDYYRYGVIANLVALNECATKAAAFRNCASTSGAGCSVVIGFQQKVCSHLLSCDVRRHLPGESRSARNQ